MIDKIFLWTEKFLNRFSYSGKTRFICFLGVFYAFFLTFEIFLTQHALIQMFQQKVVGLAQHRELSQLLEDSSDLEFLLATKRNGKENIEKEVEALAEKVEIGLKSIANSMQVDKANIAYSSLEKERDGSLLIDKTIKQWENIGIARKKSRNLPIAALTIFSQNILDLMEQNMMTHSLRLGVEMPILLLSEITMSRIPAVQNIVTTIVTLPLQIKQGQKPFDASLQYRGLITDLQGKIKTMKVQIGHVVKENQSIGDERRSAAVITMFEEYEEIVMTYIKHLKETHKAFKTSPVFAKQVLKEAWKVENSLMDFLDADVKEALHILYRRQRFSFLILFIGLLSFLAMYMTRMIRRPLEDLKCAATALADGDLSARVAVTSKDEVSTISKAFNEMAEVWEGSLVKAKSITLRLVDASVAIFDIVKKLEANVASQEISVESMRNQAREIGMTTQKFNEVLREVNKSIAVTSNFAEVGRYNLVEMEAITQQMKEASRLIVDTLAVIGLQVDKINGVLITVVSIADQSNLLSLNTAIRASQTGIKGVGFAVVAGKIRELADRTAFATLDIEETVQNIVKVVATAVEDVEKFSSQILDQVSDEKKISEQLKVRIDQTQQQIKTFDKIQNDMDIQFKEILQISALINELVQVTTETGRSARKLKQDAEFLFRGTQDLQEIIDRFHFQQ